MARISRASVERPHPMAFAGCAETLRGFGRSLAWHYREGAGGTACRTWTARLIMKVRLATFPRGVLYGLTPKGAALVKVLDQLESWSKHIDCS